MESFLYTALYTAVQEVTDPHTLHKTLISIKRDILNLHNLSQHHYFLGAQDQDHLGEERPTLFHLVKRWKNANVCHIDSIQDDDRTVYTTSDDIKRILTAHIRQKYATIPIPPVNIHDFLAPLQVRLPAEARTAFSLPFTEEELKVAVRNGKRNKALGIDGIPTDFFLLAWDTVKTDILNLVNEMYNSASLPALQTRGVVVCVPKIPQLAIPTNYRFLTLLNADHKLFARILAARLKPWLSSLLHPSQYGGTGDTNILDALATIRDTIAEAEFTRHPVSAIYRLQGGVRQGRPPIPIPSP